MSQTNIERLLQSSANRHAPVQRSHVGAFVLHDLYPPIKYHIPFGKISCYFVVGARTRENETVVASLAVAPDVESGDRYILQGLNGEHLTSRVGVGAAPYD